MRTVLVTGSAMLVMPAGCSEQPTSGGAAVRLEKALPEVVARVGGTLVDGTGASGVSHFRRLEAVIRGGRLDAQQSLHRPERAGS